MRRLTNASWVNRVLLTLGSVGALLSVGGMPARAQAPVRMQIVLVDVKCSDKEDLTGADEFYIVGGASDGIHHSGALTRPMDMDNRQTKSFNPREHLLFNARVAQGAHVIGGLAAFDEDCGKDWSRYGETVQKIADVIAAGVSALGYPEAGKIISGAVKVVGFLCSQDDDDQLGTVELDIPAEGPNFEIKTAYFGGCNAFGCWNYIVRYAIYRGTPQLKVLAEPNAVPAGTPTTLTVRAEDVDTHAPVTGEVRIGGATVGSTGIPFTYTFHGPGPARGTLVAAGYPETTFQLSLRLRKITPRVTPNPVPLGRAVQVTVFAEDSVTRAQVAGKVRIDGVIAGNANTPFTYMFNSRLHGPLTNRSIVYPKGQIEVTNPDYEKETAINFGFPPDHPLGGFDPNDPDPRRPGGGRVP